MNAPGPHPNDPAVLLTFRLGEERHALAIEALERAIPAAAITPLPAAPRPVLGLIDLAGELVPVLSVRRRLGLADLPLSPDHHFLVAHMGRRRVLLAVDEVQAVVERAWVPAPEDVGFAGLRGVARLDDGLVLIHDLEAFFAPEEWRALDGALAGARGAA
jgi:purine-binding chemotaxis protein CheW